MEFKIGDVVKVARDETNEFVEYHGQVVGVDEDGVAVSFSYNMTRLGHNKWGAYFDPQELTKEG